MEIKLEVCSSCGAEKVLSGGKVSVSGKKSGTGHFYCPNCRALEGFTGVNVLFYSKRGRTEKFTPSTILVEVVTRSCIDQTIHKFYHNGALVETYVANSGYDRGPLKKAVLAKLLAV